MNPKILIIIPAFNEAGSIRRLLEEIQAACPHADCVVINDGSSDGTAEEAREAGAPVANLPFNLGIGGAVQTGYQIAHERDYDIAVQVDGDGQHDPAFIGSLIVPILEKKLDLCIGSRFLEQDASSFRSTAPRRIGISFFCQLLRFLTGLYLTDPTSGFRATGKTLNGIFARYYPVDFPEPEAIKIAKRHSMRIGEVPVRMRTRQSGRSSIRYLATLYYMIKVTFAILLDLLKKKS
ncbi:MAG: glycosyltransferase family 2 protein [Candidatus Omnitrophica bacterium]|nr:glycosyltransferase family 2 protein [Candidatus Omnitrophota bacterium]